jgi:hypothetical protein
MKSGRSGVGGAALHPELVIGRGAGGVGTSSVERRLAALGSVGRP